MGREDTQKITDAVTAVTSEKLREVTWVIVNEVRSGNWGVGGVALGLDDVKKIIAGT
jgi:4-oxalocrotonate tautomerase